MVHFFNTSTWETEAGKSLSVPGQPGLHNEILCQNKTPKTKIKPI